MTATWRADWATFVDFWNQARRRDAARGQGLVEDVVRSGLQAVVAGLPVKPGRRTRAAAFESAANACHIALIRASGLFDEEGYLSANPDVRTKPMDPVVHYARHGWSELRNPSLDFDVWWYWNEHLDPTVETIDPFLHFIVSGRFLGFSGLPAATSENTLKPRATETPVRRICLFAGFDRDGLVDEYVVEYVRELSRFCDVYYLADCPMDQSELDKLAGITQGAWAFRHGAYDFGSYSVLARELVGWETIESYDELLLVNDSCYLLRPLDAVFAEMDATACDWWGMQTTVRHFSGEETGSAPISLTAAKEAWMPRGIFRCNDYLHVGSYFLAYRRSVIQDAGFRHRLNSVTGQQKKIRIIDKYETGFTRYLTLRGFDFSTVIDHVFPYHPVYGPSYFEMLRLGFPFLKRQFVSDNPYDTPDLVAWKERVLELVPEAPVEMLERNLLRTAPDDRLKRSFAIVTRPDGTVQVPTLLTAAEFTAEDEVTPKFDHWWAFPVCAYDHTFSGNDRAVFEAVRHDPSIKKIVLTRSRRIHVEGENVVVVPLASPEGQHHLLRAGQIFVKHAPRVNTTYPLSPTTHNFINLWHGIPLKRFGHASLDTPARRQYAASEHKRCRAVVTSSRMDSLAMTAAFHPLGYEHMWPTGLPRNDFVLCDDDRLPADLRTEEQHLRQLVGDRKLVLFLPTFKDGQADAYYDFSDTELKWLADWCERTNTVIGVREHMADTATTYSRSLGSIGALNLGAARFPNVEILYRVGAALISDYSSSLLDFTLTGRPIVSFAYDHHRYATKERGLFYDLDTVLPGPVCRTFDQLSDTLERLFTPLDARVERDYARRRSLFFDHVDDQNADRVVRRVKGLYR